MLDRVLAGYEGADQVNCVHASGPTSLQCHPHLESSTSNQLPSMHGFHTATPSKPGNQPVYAVGAMAC